MRQIVAPRRCPPMTPLSEAVKRAVENRSIEIVVPKP